MPHTSENNAKGSRVAVVEDDDRVIRMLTRFFESRGLIVRGVSDVTELPETLREFQPDIMLLDWSMPVKSGIDVLKELRQSKEYKYLPIIMITAKGDELDRVEGLLSGADDYLVKPFSLAELDARIISILRRLSRKSPNYLDHHVSIFPEEKRLHVKGKEITLTPHEWSLLTELLRAGGGTLSREQLVNRIWGSGLSVGVRSVDVIIARIRRLIEPKPNTPRYLLTDRGQGYRFGNTLH